MLREDGAPVDALRETLAALGVEDTHLAGDTIGDLPSAGTMRDESDLARISLPPAAVQERGEFVVREELGRGGMGIVELATQRALNRDVAIKRLISPSESHVAALLREATIAGQLEHPNIVPVHALVSTDGGPSVVMKRVTGTDWQASIRLDETTLETHIDILVQLCRALSFAHSRDVVHRDVKPANVMIGEYGEVYLVDWGLARRLVEGKLVNKRIAGTPAYMAPEMVRGDIDVRTDVYLLGSCLHEVLVGVPRHQGESLTDVLMAAQESKPVAYPSSVPAELAGVCNRACSRDPDRRYASADELRDALQSYLRHRAATELVHAAEERVAELTALPREGDYGRAQRLFHEARFGYEQALSAWPGSARAQQGREECLKWMAEYELECGHEKNAAAVIDAMKAPQAALREELADLQSRLREERTRVEGLKRDHDPLAGAAERGRATLWLAVGIVGLVLAFVAVRVFFPHYATPKLRLVLVAGVVLCVGSAIILRWRKTAALNLINRRIAQVLIGTLSLSLVNRLLGYLASREPTTTLHTDALIVLGGGLALSPFHRAGRGLAFLAGVVACVGALHPGWLEAMFIGLSLVVPLLFFGTRLRRREA